MELRKPTNTEQMLELMSNQNEILFQISRKIVAAQEDAKRRSKKLTNLLFFLPIIWAVVCFVAFVALASFLKYVMLF